MANRDPEPESRHQQFSDEYLAKNKGKDLSLPAPVAVTHSAATRPGVVTVGPTGPSRFREFMEQQKAKTKAVTDASSPVSFFSKK